MAELTSIPISIPTVLHIDPRDLGDGLLVVMNSDLDLEAVNEMKRVLLEGLGPDFQGGLVVTNLEAGFVHLDEEDMEEMGWVRAKTLRSDF